MAWSGVCGLQGDGGVAGSVGGGYIGGLGATLGHRGSKLGGPGIIWVPSWGSWGYLGHMLGVLGRSWLQFRGGGVRFGFKLGALGGVSWPCWEVSAIILG